MLGGVWINCEDESVAFMAKGDTLYYPDSGVLPAHFSIYGDTICIDGTSQQKYFIEKLTPNLFVFRNANSELVKFVKTDDRSALSDFEKSSEPVQEVNQQLLKRDTIVGSGSMKYHCYTQINPTTYKVVKDDINDEGVGIGKVFYDNVINITVYSDGRRLYSHDFWKREFSKFVPEATMRQSILSDIVYKSCTAEKVTLQAQLRIPGSASSYVVDIAISQDGKMSMSQP